MDWESYKNTCDQPNVFTRWMLEQTLELLEQRSTKQGINAALATTPLDKPKDHLGDKSTDMFLLNLPRSIIEMVYQAVRVAENCNVTTSETRSRGLGGFSAAWGEYLESAS